MVDQEGDEMTAAEITLMLLDWMCIHKVTDSAAADVWSLVRAAVPSRLHAAPSLRGAVDGILAIFIPVYIPV